jgi:hypothetical protein
MNKAPMNKSMLMKKSYWRGVLLLAALALAPAAQAQEKIWPRSIDLAATYSVERAKIASGDCGCIWLQGGSLEAAAPLFHGIGLAANFSGAHSSYVGSGLDLSVISFMAGPRYTLATHRWTDRFLGEKHHTSIFGEALFGVAHGFNSLFPSSSGLITTSATSFSMQIGGGLNIRLAKSFGLRALELDYVRTTLPNTSSNTQNNLRLAFGISYHLGRRSREKSSQP